MNKRFSSKAIEDILKKRKNFETRFEDTKSWK